MEKIQLFGLAMSILAVVTLVRLNFAAGGGTFIRIYIIGASIFSIIAGAFLLVRPEQSRRILRRVGILN